jgi:predicted MFS family arabinose efflux permease
VIALAIPFVALFMRDTPRQLGLRRLGSDHDEIESAVENPIVAAMRALFDATRSPAFWLLAGSFFVCGASTNGLIGTHLIPACVDHGFSEVHGANLLAAMGICDLIGTTLSGWLSDRFSNRWLLFFYYGLRGLSLLLLPWSFDLQSFKLPLFAVFYGLDWIATVPPTVALTARIFGRDRVGLVFGWIFAAHQLGAAAAASFAGTLRTVEGTYDHAFLISGNLCIIAAVSILFIGVRPSRVANSSELGSIPVGS